MVVVIVAVVVVAVVVIGRGKVKWSYCITAKVVIVIVGVGGRRALKCPLQCVIVVSIVVVSGSVVAELIRHASSATPPSLLFALFFGRVASKSGNLQRRHVRGYTAR